MWLDGAPSIDTLWLLGTVLLLLVLLVRIRTNANPLNAIPGPKSYPIIGNVYEMFQLEAVDLFLSWSETYGKILKYSVFLLGTHVMVSDADVLKYILVTNNSNYKKPESLLIPVRKIFGSRCVICLPSKEHQARRKILNPAFNTSTIRNKAVIIRQCSLRLVSMWKSDTVIQLKKDLSRLTLDILGESIFGYKFECIGNPDSELVSALHRLASVKDMNILRFLPFCKYLPTRFNRDLDLIKKFVKNVIESKQSHVVGDGPVDMLDIMLQSRRISKEGGDKTQLTDDDIVDDILLFTVAGHETATDVLCWTMYELARNLDIQHLCRQEVLKLVESGCSLDYNSSDRLVIIECCIKEAMRLYPPVPLTSRQNINDDVLGGYFIPAGTVIALQLAAMMRNPHYYDEPTVFKPSRFLGKNHKHHFLPFLAGPDMCIGHKFAMLEMKLIIATLLQDHRFELTPGSSFRGTQGLTYHIKPSLYLKVFDARDSA